MTFIKFLGVLALACLGQGCVAAAAGAVAAVGYFQYESNEHSRDFEASYEHTVDALRMAFAELGFEIISEDLSEPDRARFDAEDLKVWVERYPEDVSRVTVRAGTFSSRNNRRRADLILEEVSFLLE